jgi:phenylalanyl-tRNA synthetase beta chain
MKIPVSWLGDFVNLKGLTVEEIARRLTFAGLEVDEIIYVGWSPEDGGPGRPHEVKTSGISWDRDKIVVAEVREVMPHPNADRLTLLDLYDGAQQHTVLTGAPNLFHLKGQGRLPAPLKVAYAMEGATLFDGHAAGLQLTTLKRTKIRGVESASMVCSEKELGISEDHEGIIILDPDAPVGTPLADYMGDAVLEIDILPNMARNASVIGVARELAALTGRKLVHPKIAYKTDGAPVRETVSLHITEPELNPRFVLGLIRGVTIQPSPYHVQRRLKLAGMRPINCIVDATNYAMLELGEPLHAFDYDVLKERAGNKPIRISTRTAKDGERLTTLDGVDRRMTAMNVLVCDGEGPLSIAGAMGGAESEVHDASKDVLDAKGIETKAGELLPGKISIRGRSTTNVLLEGAAWNFINIRRTAQQHNLPSEASFRFSRGVHPALAETGVRRGLQYMALWSGGSIAPGLVDEYPLRARNSVVTFSPADAKRLLGIDLPAKEIARLLESLEFICKIREPSPPRRKSRAAGKNQPAAQSAETRITVTAPPHRLDIGEGIIGVADVLEEVARLCGYDRIPTTNMADALPPQVGNPAYEWDERVRDVLTTLGFDEVVSHRLTSAEREARLGVSDPHVVITNPVAPDKSRLRRSLLASVLDDLERNVRCSDSLAFFEIGPVFEPKGSELPDELPRLALAMTGLREQASWDDKPTTDYDFFDLKGRIEELLAGLQLGRASFSPAGSSPHLHPGKSAEVRIREQLVGTLGELHPMVKEHYEFGPAPVLVAEFDVALLRSLKPRAEIVPVPEYPPVLEDIALILDQDVPASRVEELIREAGGDAITNVRLFDIYRGEQVGEGKKSLAYRLTYQAPDRTLTDAEAAAIRNRIVKRLEHELGATLRSV